MTPVLTVLVPCYNYARYVGECLDSILSQTLSGFEVIATDDASTDDSAAVLARYAGDPRVRVISHRRNIGHIRTYAEGIAEARGRHIVIVSADDLCLDPRAFERQVELMESRPNLAFVYSAWSNIDREGRTLSVTRPWEHDFVRNGLKEFRLLLFRDHVNHLGTMVRRHCYMEAPYNEALPNSGDWDMWLRLSARYDVGYIADPLYAYRLHGSNMSHTRAPMGQAIDDARRVIERAFRALPPQAAPELAPLQAEALRHCLVHQAKVELAFGRLGRAWGGLLAAVTRDPTVLVRSSFPLALLLRTVLGRTGFHYFHSAYRRMRPRPAAG